MRGVGKKNVNESQKPISAKLWYLSARLISIPGQHNPGSCQPRPIDEIIK